MCMEWGSHFERTRGACQLGTLPSREGGRSTTTVGYRNQWSRRSCSVAKVVGTFRERKHTQPPLIVTRKGEHLRIIDDELSVFQPTAQPSPSGDERNFLQREAQYCPGRSGPSTGAFTISTYSYQ